MQAFDLLLLAFKGIAIASVPIASVWIGRKSAPGGRLRRLAWLTVFLTFDLVVFGGFTRLTDSGLGCPDWPGCYAKANPLMAAGDIQAAEQALPSGPVTMNKAWIEMIHRYLAMAVGLLIVVMLVMSVARARQAARRPVSPPTFPVLAAALLGLVVVQGAFGAWTVTQKLQPIFVTTHLMLGLGLLGLLVWHALKLDDTVGSTGRAGYAAGASWLAPFALAVLGVQVALGGWVSANYAVLACNDFPTCQGVWFPPMDFFDGFSVWRDLGRSSTGGYLSIEALTAIHWTHRAFAAVAFLVLATLAWRIRGSQTLTTLARTLFAVLAVQCLTGLANVVLGWPLLAAVLHNAGAAALVVTVVMINYRLLAKPLIGHAAGDSASLHATRMPRMAG